MGRPSDYNIEIAERICLQIMEGKSLRKICEAEDMPDKVTVLRWVLKHEDFRNQYMRAREVQMENMADEILEISDDKSRDTTYKRGRPVENFEWTNRSRLRVDTRKWLMSKLAPKKYGDKLDVTSDGQKIHAVQVEIVRKQEEKPEGEV